MQEDAADRLDVAVGGKVVTACDDFVTISGSRKQESV
jgi:hypothetical protein